MITIDVAEYSSACMDFDPDVQRPQKAYGMKRSSYPTRSFDAQIEIGAKTLSDT